VRDRSLDRMAADPVEVCNSLSIASDCASFSDGAAMNEFSSLAYRAVQ
jgi:hypothetical protein